ncbi:MAG: MotA/TolQ/ExbB proton channel family protein [Thermodesulfobacteriota bacterium]
MRVYDIINGGGPVMWPLLACSVAVLTVIIERALFWFSMKRKRNQPLMDEVLSLAESGDWEEIRKKTSGCHDHVIRLLVVGIVHRDYDMGRAMESEANLMTERMNRSMPVLDTMITVAPLLGIFGTVLGIIGSFKILGTSGIADPKLVTAGIAQALITTATGLGIAIIAVIPYNYFNTRIDKAIHVMEKYATNLEVVYEKLEDKS